MKDGQWDRLSSELSSIRKLLTEIRDRLPPHQTGPWPILPVTDPVWGGDRCMICGEPGGHGNLPCPKMAPRS